MIAIPATKLWTPRRGSWWRLPRFDSLLAAHLKKSPTTGHLLKTGTGHLSKGCSAGGCPCSSPADKLITISGSNIVDGFCWYYTSGALTVGWKIEYTLDDTYTVPWRTFPGGLCQWDLGAIGSPASGSSFADTTCATFGDGDAEWILFTLLLFPSSGGKYRCSLSQTSPEYDGPIYDETDSNETFSPIDCEVDEPTFTLPLHAGFGGAGSSLTVSVTT